jgi:hypothetical protein
MPVHMEVFETPKQEFRLRGLSWSIETSDDPSPSSGLVFSHFRSLKFRETEVDPEIRHLVRVNPIAFAHLGGANSGLSPLP